ncbi:MAG: polysaccharide pyruvyl transferase family protein [Bacteroidaceae bacterium]|nr:polysaccharide pyruvyl transferase family protein [Bacteroidaceae bacterium]
MSIALLTFHRAYNYGARLQAYALYKKLCQMGEKCVIVRYETPEQVAQYKTFQMDFSILGIMRNIRNLIIYRVYYKRRQCFDRFSNNYCEYSEIVRDKHRLHNLLNSFQIVMIGSDQTWNVMERAFDDAYLLPFELSGRKISYASSTGDDLHLWSESDIDKMVTHLSDFSYISVRESDAIEMLKLKGIQACQVVDPTILLNKEEWDYVKSHTIISEDEYILYYTVKATDFSVKFVQKLSRVLGIRVIAIHPRNKLEFNSGFVRKIDMGPDSFIEYISKAKYVVTTSFHATIFSIIYNKPFLCPTTNQRIVDLLGRLCLSKRLVSSLSDISTMDEQIDWEMVTDNLQSLRIMSEEYLKNAIKNG